MSELSGRQIVVNNILTGQQIAHSPQTDMVLEAGSGTFTKDVVWGVAVQPKSEDFPVAGFYVYETVDDHGNRGIDTTFINTAATAPITNRRIHRVDVLNSKFNSYTGTLLLPTVTDTIDILGHIDTSELPRRNGALLLSAVEMNQRQAINPLSRTYANYMTIFSRTDLPSLLNDARAHAVSSAAYVTPELMVVMDKITNPNRIKDTSKLFTTALLHHMLRFCMPPPRNT